MWFLHKFYMIWFDTLDTFYRSSFFSQLLLYSTMFSATAKCNIDGWKTRMISTSAGTNGVRLAWHISLASMVTYHFFFRNSVWWNLMFQKIHSNVYFWGITVTEMFLKCFFSLKSSFYFNKYLQWKEHIILS